MNFYNINETIRQRRSIFPPVFSDEPATDQQVWQLLENARWAPNHKGTEPWRFRVFTGSTRERLAQHLAEHYKAHSGPSFSLTKYHRTHEKALRSSHIIAICMHRNQENIVPEWEEIAAVACAVQNMWLTATALGLCGYWSTPKAAVDGGRDIFELDEAERCLGLFYLGKPKPVALTTPGHRDPIDQKVRWM